MPHQQGHPTISVPIGFAESREAGFDRLERKAELGGSVPVIVRLQDDAVPAIERPSSGPGARDVRFLKRLATRKAVIARLHDRVTQALADLPEAPGRYNLLPLMAMQADRDSLARLRARNRSDALQPPGVPRT